MIEEIVEMILKEARRRTGTGPAGRLYNVLGEINRKVEEIIDNLSEEERRLRDKDKG